MQQSFEHEPGSPEAIAQGCTCPPQAGPGAVMGHDGTPGFACDWRCPMHGIEVLKGAMARGEARLIKPDEDQDEPTRH
jgi:hypothetical protein